MRQGCLVPNMAEATLVCLRPKDGVIEMQLRARRSFSTCPACGTASRRVHSHYQRKLSDLPWAGLPVVILLSLSELFVVESLHAGAERGVRSGSGSCDVALQADPAISGT